LRFKTTENPASNLYSPTPRYQQSCEALAKQDGRLRSKTNAIAPRSPTFFPKRDLTISQDRKAIGHASLRTAFIIGTQK